MNGAGREPLLKTPLNNMYITTKGESKEGGISVIINPTSVWSMIIFTS